MSRGWTLLWAVLSVMVAGVLAVTVSLAAGAVPKSWGWAHDGPLMWSVVAGLLIAGGLIALLQARSTGSKDDKQLDSMARTNEERSSAAVGSNTGTLINAHMVVLSADSTTRLATYDESPAQVPPDKARKAREFLPRRNGMFTGRAALLDEIWRDLASGPVAIVAVQGLGGVGKSQLALEYAHRMRTAGRYWLAGWIRADSPVTIAEDLAALAPALGLDAEGPAGMVAAAVVTALGGRADWLLVFDNAQAPDDVAAVLPTAGGHVLFTSRNRGWGRIATQITLEVFARDESVTFLRNRSGRREREAFGKLADELGDLPLALAQAGAYIDTHGITINDYLALYRGSQTGGRLRAEGLDSDEYPVSVARTWLLHFEELSRERPASIELLRLCAYLDPDEIDLSLFSLDTRHVGKVLAGAVSDEFERAETVGALARANLLTPLDGGRLRIHRLVQAVTRDQLNNGQSRTWVTRVLALITDSFPVHPELPSSWAACAALASHAESVLNFSEKYSELAAASGHLLDSIGTYLIETAQLSAARSSLERALSIKEGRYGSDHTEVARTLGLLGIAQRKWPDLEASRRSLERAVSIEESSYGPQHSKVGDALINLGNLQRAVGDFAAARRTLERALSIEETSYGPGHPAVATTLGSLSNVLYLLGDLEAARACMERALSIFEAADGPDHPDIAKALEGLGMIYQGLGNAEAARRTLERALSIEETSYGPEHPAVARTLSKLSDIFDELGNLEAAQSSLARALRIFEATGSRDRPYIPEVPGDLPLIERRLGSDLKGGRSFLERIARIRRDPSVPG